MSKDESIGVSNKVFVMGLIIAILVSSMISVVVAMLFVGTGKVGPQGAKGDAGQQGPKGDPGTGIVASASTSVLSSATTTATDWSDIPGTAVTLTLGNTSNLLIMFTSEAGNSDPSGRVEIRAMLGSNPANTAVVGFTTMVGDATAGTPHTHELGWASYACNFYVPSVSSGTYTVKIQWVVSGINGVSVGTNSVGYRTLSVIALQP